MNGHRMSKEIMVEFFVVGDVGNSGVKYPAAMRRYYNTDAANRLITTRPVLIIK